MGQGGWIWVGYVTAGNDNETVFARFDFRQIVAISKSREIASSLAMTIKNNLCFFIKTPNLPK